VVTGYIFYVLVCCTKKNIATLTYIGKNAHLKNCPLGSRSGLPDFSWYSKVPKWEKHTKIP
jgi:hypothetical protein